MNAASAFSNEEGGRDSSIFVPTLRQDLEISQSWSRKNGEPTWTIFDPLRNQYFRIGRTFFVLLTYWDLSKFDDVRAAAKTWLRRDIETDEIAALVKFLLTNQLTNVSPESGYRGYYERAQAGRKGFVSTALHGYLFFKVPIFRPDKFLSRTWPYVQYLFTRTAVSVCFIIGCIGLYLVSRQWPAFQDNFMELLSIEGAILYGLSLVFVKIVHEFGHAYMAHRYGLKVSIIGVAFLVLMPILYTDTSNAWRLTCKKKRLMVDGAGIIVELGLACLATFLWVFFPDGAIRSILFSVAAVSWTLSLLINLNPFMRFDGYFILSDFLEVENLQARGFALARWRLRELLFGLNVHPPENIEPTLQRALIFHAWGTWIYRFFLFLGIALLIYTFFIKVVAIFLFAVEIIWFICLPVFRELREWWNMREQIATSRRSFFTLGAFIALIVGFLLPLSNTVSVVGVVHAAKEVNVYAPYPAKLVVLNAKNKMPVVKGDTLAVFESEELALKVQLLKKKIALLQKRIDRSGRDRIDGDNRLVLRSELAGQKEELESFLLQQDQLTIKADMNGVISDLANTVHIGRFLDQSAPLFRVRSPHEIGLTGLVDEMLVDRLRLDAEGTFYPDNLMLASMPVRLKKINKSSTQVLSFPAMSVQFGGKIQSQPSSSNSNAFEVSGSYFGLGFSSEDQIVRDYRQTQRGVVHIDAEPKSLATKLFERIGTVLIRESGF